MANQTPLYEQHLALGAKIAVFQNWSLPLNFGSQIDEHHAVRQQAGMFDVSHMMVTDIEGAGSQDFLRYILANNIDKLSQPGRALYSLMLNESGGIIDDLIVYFLAPNKYRIVSNAGTRQRVSQWFEQHAHQFECHHYTRNDLVMIAVQGPHALNMIQPFLPTQVATHTAQLKPFHICDADNWFIAATGYTGESGVEVLLPIKEGQKFWTDCNELGVTPCGLGARDTLRLEAGFCLYGQDMDEQTSPFACRLDWTLALEPSERDFIGKKALLEARKNTNEDFVGLVMRERGVMRTKMPLYQHEQQEEAIGFVTSGGFSPTLGCSIALARVKKTTTQTAYVCLRQGWIRVDVVDPVFFRRGKIVVKG